MDLLEQALALRGRRLRFAFATVIEAEGSTPRHVGAKMIVTEAGEVFGTIGGGNLEAKVIAAGRAAIAAGSPSTLTLALGPALGQCCGGRVAIFIEPDERPDALYLFGAGHVAKELCHVAPALGFQVTVIDPRPEWNSQERFPLAHQLLVEEGLEAVSHLPFDAHGTWAAVMTHDHRADEDILRALLERPLRYVGLIGSRTKWARFRQRFLARGLTQPQLSSVRTPIGLELAAETPAEIAIAIAAELVQLRRARSAKQDGAQARDEAEERIEDEASEPGSG